MVRSERKVNHLLFADDTGIVEGRKEMLQNLITQFWIACEATLKVNAANSKVME